MPAEVSKEALSGKIDIMLNEQRHELKERNPEEYWGKLLWAYDCYAKHWDTSTTFESARRKRARRLHNR